MVVVELHDGDDLVRIAVRDEGCAPGEPHPSPQRPEEEHGRGLLLVDALSHAWGAQEHGPGLLVWADLPRKADSPHDPAEPRNDLGWGARPKPGRPADGTGDGDGTAGQAHQSAADDDGTFSAAHHGHPADGIGTIPHPHPHGTGVMGIPSPGRRQDWGRA